MLLRPFLNSIRPTFRPTASLSLRTFTRPSLPLYRLNKPTMSNVATPEVPPAAQGDAPNLQKDPETGEMVSKRCVPLQ
jgi:hypothetical protein